MALKRSSIYGVGLAYPLRLDDTNSRPAIASEESLVKMSMRQILLTGIGERPFLVRNGVPYGTRIRHVTFESVEQAKDLVNYEAKRALEVWEPRIVVIKVETVSTPNTSGGATLAIRISFRYRSTNRVDNFVIPFRTLRPTA